jgi:hypothetical protein
MNSTALVRYELWLDEGSYSFFPDDSESFRRLLSSQAQLVWECHARNWEEAQTEKHKYLGWEPYVPMR